MARAYPMLLTTKNDHHTLALRIADTFGTRLVGLLSTGKLFENEGLLITRCNNVHTFGMRMTIDVIYLDKTGRVLKCVPHLKPFRASYCKAAASTLELAQGSVNRLGIAPGDLLDMSAIRKTSVPSAVVANASGNPHNCAKRWHKQAGAAMLEFVVVGPVITLMGMATLQSGLLFFAKNNFNQAAFMAARAGSTGNASPAAVKNAYIKALVPQYGGGTNTAELKASFDRATADVNANVRFEMLNPSKESFDDWNDTALQNTIGKGKRVIPNANMGLKDANEIRSNSGQNIGDANLIKLRITHGYEPKVPFVGNMMLFMLRWYDDGKDSFKTELYDKSRPSGGKGFIPVVTDVTLKMQSDAIEPDNPVSLPGPGNDGSPQDPGPGTPPKAPPKCLTIGCSVVDNNPVDPGGICTGANCPACRGPVAATTSLPGDVLFSFNQSSLTAAGAAALDQYIAAAKDMQIKSAEVTGYADQTGEDSFNLPLSQARAKTVKDYLVSHGFPAVPINAVGLGATNLKTQLSDCPGKSRQALYDCLKANRRVEIKLS